MLTTDRPFLEQIALQFAGKLYITALNPFQQHGSMLLLLVAMVSQYGLKGRISAGFGPLVIEVNSSSSSISDLTARCISIEARLSLSKGS
jgi:hypothetical protein